MRPGSDPRLSFVHALESGHNRLDQRELAVRYSGCCILCSELLQFSHAPWNQMWRVRDSPDGGSGVRSAVLQPDRSAGP